MPSIIFAGPGSFLQVRVLRLATCWKMERKDGTKFFFTDHNKRLQVGLGGDTFTPVDGLSTTARQKQASLKPSNFEARGIIDVDAITNDDLRSGLFRGTEITEYVVDWMHAWAGYLTRTKYWIETTTFNGEYWEAQISGLVHKFKSRIGAVYSRSCRYDLGDSLCLFDIDALEVTVIEVAAIVNSVLEFDVVSDPGGDDDYWAYGKLTWTKGINTGVEVEIAEYTRASTRFKLRLPTAHPISIGDQFTAVPGCNKTLTQCREKFDNVVNFGGFPQIPGNDSLISGPVGAKGGKKDK